MALLPAFTPQAIQETVCDLPTIRGLLEERAEKDPEHIYCSFAGQDYTIGEIDRRANQIANGLLELGLRPGDRVILMLDHHPEHVAVLFALAKAGLVRVSVNIYFKGAALAHMLGHARPRALIVDASHDEQVEPELDRSSVEILVRRGGASGPRPAVDFARLWEHANAAPPPVRIEPDTVLAINYTSGTTGAPKGALRSDKLLRAGPVAYRPLADLRPGDVMVNWEPFYHAGGTAILIAALMVPITLAMIDRFSASQHWRQIREAGATQLHFIGGILHLLLKQPPGPGDRYHRVRVAWGGGCPVEVWRRLEERFGVRVHEGYGISEIANFVTINCDGRVGAVGRPLPYFDVSVADDAGRAVPTGELGEILIRGRERGLDFLGYFEDPAATSAAMRNGWFRTGDLGRFDADGYLHFAGRKKDSLRRRGVNISAWEVERVIGEHEAIEECALIAVPSGLGDDDLKIVIKAAAGRRLDPLELIKWCEPRMPYFQIPRYVAFIEEFPKTPSQRIRKGELPPTTAGCWDLEASGYRIDRKRVVS
ncbi:MAG: ATP-dependent acyl-CoA ligase [Alphaproteobacteria bacterium]|nr:ATP-dependent acyl-CoA ligase [Alphaproteobacteria bacterium]